MYSIKIVRYVGGFVTSEEPFVNNTGTLGAHLINVKASVTQAAYTLIAT